MTSEQDMKAELERLRAENEALKKQSSRDQEPERSDPFATALQAADLVRTQVRVWQELQGTDSGDAAEELRELREDRAGLC